MKLTLELNQRKLSIEQLLSTDQIFHCDFCEHGSIASFLLIYENYIADTGQLDAVHELFEIKLCYECKDYLGRMVHKVG